MMNTAISFLLPLLLASSAYAHGHVANVTIGGQAFQGAFPFGDGKPSTEGVVRNVKDNGPVHFSGKSALTCGTMASAVEDVAVGKAGDLMQFAWNDGGNWIHDTGPMLTYMAACTNGDCTTFDTSTAKWFKIDEQGFDPSASTDANAKLVWLQARVQAGAKVNVTIPSTLKAGPYMVRHEIIALHLASGNDVSGVEFYPSCLQLNVTGDGTEEPADAELVEFPGGYTDDDPGLLVDPYNLKSRSSYTFPGPALAALVGTSSGEGKGTTESASPSTTASDESTPSSVTSTGNPSVPTVAKASSSTSSKTCKRSGKKSSFKKRSDAKYRPRHYSRIMRGLGFKGLR